MKSTCKLETFYTLIEIFSDVGLDFYDCLNFKDIDSKGQ